MRPIDADAFSNKMYYEAFENDASYNESNPMAKWDSGLWIRYKLFENAIDEVPTIEQKRGEWVRAMDGYDMHVKCTLCFKTYDWDSEAQYYNYCPNCGADMRGTDNE